MTWLPPCRLQLPLPPGKWRLPLSKMCSCSTCVATPVFLMLRSYEYNSTNKHKNLADIPVLKICPTYATAIHSLAMRLLLSWLSPADPNLFCRDLNKKNRKNQIKTLNLINNLEYQLKKIKTIFTHKTYKCLQKHVFYQYFLSTS